MNTDIVRCKCFKSNVCPFVGSDKEYGTPENHKRSFQKVKRYIYMDLNNELLYFEHAILEKFLGEIYFTFFTS